MYSKKQKTSFRGTIFTKRKKKHTDTIHISWHKSRNLPYFPLRHWDVIHGRQVRYLWVTASAWKHVIFLPSFFSPFLLKTGSHYVAQAEQKLTELSLCLPQPGKLFHFYTYTTSQYFMILFSHSNRVLSMNTTQLIFLLGKKRHQWQYVTYTNIWDHL